MTRLPSFSLCYSHTMNGLQICTLSVQIIFLIFLFLTGSSIIKPTSEMKEHAQKERLGNVLKIHRRQIHLPQQMMSLLISTSDHRVASGEGSRPLPALLWSSVTGRPPTGWRRVEFPHFTPPALCLAALYGWCPDMTARLPRCQAGLRPSREHTCVLPPWLRPPASPPWLQPPTSPPRLRLPASPPRLGLPASPSWAFHTTTSLSDLSEDQREKDGPKGPPVTWTEKNFRASESRAGLILGCEHPCTYSVLHPTHPVTTKVQQDPHSTGSSLATVAVSTPDLSLLNRASP